MGKGRPLTEFEKNLREEIFKRDNHIENSVKYAIDRGDDYGILKNTPKWRRDAIEKYKNEHKTSVFDDDGNEVGKISYEARRAIRKNKLSDYTPQNDDEKRVFDYLKNRRAESEKSASELKKKTSNELFSLKNNKNRLGGIKPDVVNLHDRAAVKNEYSRTESEAKKYKPGDNEIFEIPVSPNRTVKLKYGIKKKIDNIAGENGIASDLKAKRIDEAIEKLNLSEGELSDARSYAGIKKLELASASNGKNSFIKEISQPIVKFLMGTRDTAEGAAKFLKNGGKLNGDYSEEYANIEKYYEEHPDELGNDLFDTYKSGMSNPKGDYLRNTSIDKTLEAYNDTTKASQFIGDAGFRSAGQMMGASALAYGSGTAGAVSGATDLIKNAAAGTKAAKAISKAASIAPKISKVGGSGAVSRAANTAIKKVNSLSVGKALKFLNPFDNPTTVIMGMNAAQDKYDALKKMGYDDDTSKKNALFSGYVSAITEKMGYDGKPESFFFNRNGKPIAGSAAMSKAKNAKKLIKDYLTANVSEGVEEIYNTVFERMGDYLSKVGYVDENGQLKQRKVFGNEGIFDIKDMGENFLGGFVGGAVMGSVGVLGNIASYDTKTVHEYADEVKKQVSKSNELVEKYAKESGMEAVSLPSEPDWKKASVNEINDYYEKAIDAHLNILFNENVIKSDSEKLDGAEKLIATPDDSPSAYADDEQIHDASENLSENNAGVSVQQLESGVKKLTDNLTTEYKSSYIKNIPNYQTVYNENLRLSSTPGKVVDEQFIRTYALSYAEGLRQNNSKAYKKLSAVSDDVGQMLSDYILRNKIPQGIETNEDMSALYRTAGGLKRIINRAANAVMSANNQIYGKSDTLTETANEIDRGNYSVIKYENAGDISLSKVGEYYEAYGTDAVKLKNLIPVSTHYTERNGSKTLVAAIPAGNINEYIDTLKLSANAYSAGGREFISLTPNTTDTTNGSGAGERKTDAYESNSNIEVSENEISVSSKPSARQVSEIALVISRNPSIPLILNGNEKLGETVLFYAEEEDTSRNRIESDINSYYDGVMPEIGSKIPNEYDEDMKFSVDENTDEYSAKEIENWKDSKNIVVYNNEAQFNQFVDEVLDNKKPDRKMYFGKVSENAAKNIFEKTGVDVSGYNISLKGYEIRKILLNSHGNAKSESMRGQAAINVSDLLKIPEIITNPDYVGLSDKLYNGNKVIEFRKEFNGRTVVISYVSGKHHDLQIQTMYKNIKRNLSELPSEDNSLSHTSKTRLGTVSSIDNISQNDNIVNSSIRKNAENDTDSRKNLVAVHNSSAEKLSKTLDLGGFAMPSIAVTKNDIPHENFGDISVVFNKDTVDPKADRRNKVYSADAWTPTFPQIEYEANPERVVGLNEVAFAVMPVGKYPELKAKFESKGIEVKTYDPNIENSRLDVINSRPDIRFSQDKSLDGGGGISYNDNINSPYRESRQLSEYIMAENNRNGSELKPFGCKEIGDNFYFWRNNSKTDYDVIAQVEIDGNEDIIDALRKGLENGEIYIDKGTKGFNDWLAAIRSGQRSDSGNNAVDTAELSNGNDDRLYSRQSSDDDGIKFDRESNRNQQNTEVDNYGRDDILNGDDRRTPGKSEGERGSGFREIAGNAERNAGEEQSGASTRRIYARDVKEAGGVERRNDRGVEADFVKSEYYNDEMRRIAAENDERGVVTHFILGNGRAIEYGTNFRGAVRGNEVYIQADHGKYSPTQINRHEIIHRNYSSDTVQELKNRIKSRLTNEQIRDIAERLYRDYAQKRRSFDEIFEEFVCDVMADMNDYAEMFETETREYWAAEEQDRKGYSPSTYTESIDAGGKNVAENKSQQWSQSRGLQLPKLADTITDNTNISQNDNIVNSNIRENSENDTRINTEDVKAVQSIPKKSVNDFTSEDIKKTENFAKRYYSEMGEKSPFFRAWFGDWRANDTSEVAVADKKGAVRGTTKNLDTGWDIQISGKVFNETKSHNQNYNVKARPYLDYINSIVENAVLLDSYTVPSGKAKSSNSAMMHSLYAIADMGKGKELTKLYVEELNDVNSDGTIKRAYQLQNITKQQLNDRVQVNTLAPSASAVDVNTVSQLFNIVKGLDKNFSPNPSSKVVNTDGTPKVVYHGTDNFGFTVFDTAKSDDNSTLFFTDSKDIASTYSGKEGVTQLGDESNTKYGDTPNDIVKGLNEVRSADDEFAGQRYFYLDKDGVDKINAEIDRDAYALMEYLDNYDFSNEKENVKSTAIKLDEKLNNLEYDSISTPLYMLLHHSAVFGDEKSARRFAKLEKNVRLINEIKKNRKSDVIVGEGLNGYSFYIYGIDAAKDILSKKLKMGIYSVYLNMQNPYIVDCDGKNWNDITYYEIIPDELKKFYKNGLWRHGTTREAAAYAKNEGFDGVIFENVTDNGGNNSNIENKPVNVYVAFDSNQIKSATDNIGTFDKANNDIRFSADENTDVNVSDDEDMSYLSEPVKNIKNDIREVRLKAEASHGKVFDRKDINEVCDSILNNVNTGAVRGIEIKSKKDRTVMSVLVNRVLNSAGVDAKRKHTKALARFIAQNATAYDSKSLSAADGVDYESDKAVITSYIKHGVKLSPDAKEAVISVVGESSAKGYISMMGNENALGIDAVYDELRLVMPEYFTEDLLSDGDKMRRVMEVYTWLKEGRDLQEQKLIDIMDESDRREFTDILSQQLDDAFETRGRESLLDLELVKERQRSEKKIKALEDKYRDKISELRSKAENKIKNSAEKKKIEVKQERYKFKSLSEAVSKYGRIKEGENPYRETAVPRKIDKDRYVSRFARTMVEAGVTPNEALSEFEERILSGDMTYERITDEEAKNYAEEKIKRRGFLKSLEDWDEMILSNQRIGKNEMAFGQMLYNQCINAKDAKHAMKIAADLANIATQAGQAVQACRLLKQMSPDCQLYSLEQSVSKMEDEFRQQLKFLSGKKRDIDIKINESLAQEYLNAETQEARDIVMDKLLEDIAGQIPPSLKDKWDSWRYLSMLGNPRTHIRNIGGNLVFMLPVHLKNTLSYIAEKAIPKGQRTKSYIKTAESKEFAKQDYIKMKDMIQGNSGKFEGISKINELRRIYKFKPLEGLRKANFAALEWEDGIFLKHHYENALAQIMTARGYTAEFLNSGTNEARAALEAARVYAINEAQKATYRDANAAAEALSSAQRKLQNHKYFAARAAGLALEGVVPFKKTPLNIVKRGVEYSPVGLINGVYDMAFNIKSGKATAAEAIDKLASGLVGTALTVLGMWLASVGLVRGDGDDDKNAERLDNVTGEQSYSVRIGKHSYTIDWVAPASMPFFVGVNIQKAFASDKKFTFEDIVKALVKIPDPIMSLSVLSSLSDLLSAGNYADTGAEKAAAYAWQTATSYVGQAYPTMLGQVARTIDKTKRNMYYADTENGIPDGLERFINRQLAKTPGASRLIEPKIDMWGREETYGDTWYGRFVGNALSPGYYKEIDSTALDDELRRLNEEYEGDGSVLPPKIPKYFTYEKQKYYMKPSEYTKYSVIRGQKSFEAADELIRTDDYKNKSAEEKKKALEKCYDAAADEAKNEILKGRGIDVTAKEAEKERSKKSKSKSGNKRFR